MLAKLLTLFESRLRSVIHNKIVQMHQEVLSNVIFKTQHFALFLNLTEPQTQKINTIICITVVYIQ